MFVGQDVPRMLKLTYMFNQRRMEKGVEKVSKIEHYFYCRETQNMNPERKTKGKSRICGTSESKQGF